MPSLRQFHDSPSIKMLLIGESKSGKTSALASLVRAGYSLFIGDFDGNLDYLAHDLGKTDPALLDRVVYKTFRDKTKIDRNRDVIIDGRAEAFDGWVSMLDKGIDLPDGTPSGPARDLSTSWVVVLDSLWSCGRAAFFEHQKMQPSKDPRKNFYGAGQMILSMLDAFKDPDFHPHVIVISHMTLVELDEGRSRFFPSAIGKAICVDIPKVFPRMLVVEIRGQGKNQKRIISTVPTDMIAAASALPEGAIPAALPLETGLADYFLACGAKPGEKTGG